MKEGMIYNRFIKGWSTTIFTILRRKEIIVTCIIIVENGRMGNNKGKDSSFI